MSTRPAWRGPGAVALALALTACFGPQRVDILEQPTGFLATARGDKDEPCDAKLRERVRDEIAYHCEARGRRAMVGSRDEKTVDGRCVIEVPFDCGAPVR